MPKKKFINKKKAVTFQLIHRSQQDPLVADENAPQMVLQPIEKNKETPEEREKRIEEQHKYGIYYTDDTNYLEFLKERSDNRMEWPSHIEKDIEERRKRFTLPKEVFASTKEDKVGMLNKGSDADFGLDPDVMEALENPDDHSEELEDNFIELADGVATDDEEMDIFEDDLDEQDYATNEKMNNDSETESAEDNEFSDECSSTSSMSECYHIKNTRKSYSCTTEPFKDLQQEIITKGMDKMLQKYDEIRSSNDNNEFQGFQPLTSAEQEVIDKLADEFFESQKPLVMDRDEEAAAITKSLAKKKNAFKTEYVEYDVEEKPKYDCESIISTYSTTRNRPTYLDLPPTKPRRIKVNPRTGIPMNILGQNKLTKSVLEKHDEKYGDISGKGAPSIRSTISRLTALSIRNKDETTEEKKERKKLLKEYRHERRAEKKSRRQAFITEERNLNRGRNPLQGCVTMGKN